MTDLVTLDDAKAQLRLDGTDEDTYIASLVTAASATVVDYVKSTDAGGMDSRNGARSGPRSGSPGTRQFVC